VAWTFSVKALCVRTPVAVGSCAFASTTWHHRPLLLLHTHTHAQGKYATLGMVQSYVQWRNLAILSFVAFVLLGGNSAASSLKASRVERNRARALRELEKSE
jgi:hypothetical protein